MLTVIFVLFNFSFLISQQELDMSHNLLGKDANMLAVQPDFVTGGKSLSVLLSSPTCPLRKLNVSFENSPCVVSMLFLILILLFFIFTLASTVALEHDSSRGS